MRPKKNRAPPAYQLRVAGVPGHSLQPGIRAGGPIPCRLATECAKLNPLIEKAMAEESFRLDMAMWPEY
jgi:hypothetical protein